MISVGQYSASSSKELKHLVDRDPKELQLRFFLGLKFMDEGKFEDARNEFVICLDQDPEFSDASFYLGNACYRIERFLEAATALESVPDTYSQVDKKWVLLGEIYRKWKDFETARDCYFQALRFGGKKNPVVHRGLTDLLIAGTSNLGFECTGYSLVHENIQVEKYGRVVHATIRNFTDLSDRNRRVVLLTSESENRIPQDIGVTNGAEILIEKMLEKGYNGVSEDSTFLLMHENGACGLDAMHLTRVSFVVERIKKPSPPATITTQIADFIFGKAESIETSDVKVKNLKFHQITHAEFEEMCGFRFYWETNG